ncbi:MAG: hypothetical protein JEZ12_13575 [Desulfobacterium sp.]|nr:hypothetical protein [Desulfobacterium sp.]
MGLSGNSPENEDSHPVKNPLVLKSRTPPTLTMDALPMAIWRRSYLGHVNPKGFEILWLSEKAA